VFQSRLDPDNALTEATGIPLDLNDSLKHFVCKVKGKGKAIQLQVLIGPEGSRRLRLPDFMRQSAHEGDKVVSPMHRQPLPPGYIPVTHFS
jgi:hypothetical protein